MVNESDVLRTKSVTKKEMNKCRAENIRSWQDSNQGRPVDKPIP